MEFTMKIATISSENEFSEDYRKLSETFEKLGKKDIFLGHRCTRFEFKGQNAVLVMPNNPRQDNAFVFRARFFGAFPSFDEEMLKRGYWIAHIDVADLYGGIEAMKLWDNFYKYLISIGLDKKPILEGMSRGGLPVCHFASLYPERVSCIYLDAAVCDISSWPRKAAKEDWEKLKIKLNVDEDNCRDYPNNPNKLALRIAESKIPLAFVYGDSDTAVPWEDNGEIFIQEYSQTNTPYKIWRKFNCKHHPHSLDDMSEVANYLESVIKKY